MQYCVSDVFYDPRDRILLCIKARIEARTRSDRVVPTVPREAFPIPARHRLPCQVYRKAARRALEALTVPVMQMSRTRLRRHPDPRAAELMEQVEI